MKGHLDFDGLCKEFGISGAERMRLWNLVNLSFTRGREYELGGKAGSTTKNYMWFKKEAVLRRLKEIRVEEAATRLGAPL